jgi:hypothetical protein
LPRSRDELRALDISFGATLTTVSALATGTVPSDPTRAGDHRARGLGTDGLPAARVAVTGIELSAGRGIVRRQRAEAGAPLDGPDAVHTGPHDSIGAMDRRGPRFVASAAVGTLKDLRLHGSRAT